MKLTESYLAKCIETSFSESKRSPLISIYRNVVMNYGPDPFKDSDLNEADVIIFDGREFYEFEIKCSISDFYSDFNSLLKAQISRGNVIASLLGLKDKYQSKPSKVRKFSLMAEGSYIDYFSFVMSNFTYRYIHPKVKAYLKSSGIGILLYEGDGKIKALHHPQKLARSIVKNQALSLKLVTYFNRPRNRNRNKSNDNRRPRAKRGKKKSV